MEQIVTLAPIHHLMKLEVGTNEIDVRPEDKRAYFDAANRYCEKYRKLKKTDKNPIRIDFHSSLSKLIVHVEAHQKLTLEDLDTAITARDIRDKIDQIRHGERIFFRGDYNVVARIRQLVSNEYGSLMRVHKVSGGCEVSVASGDESSFRKKVINACKGVIESNVPVSINCPKEKRAYLRTIVSQHSANLSVSIDGNTATIKVTEKKVFSDVYEAFVNGEYEDTLEFRNALKSQMQAVLNQFDELTGYKHSPKK